jgi:hypothetical protein
MLALLLLFSCTLGPSPSPDWAVTCDAPTGVFGDHPALLSDALQRQKAAVEACFHALRDETGTQNTGLNFRLTAEGAQRGVGGATFVRSDSFAQCVAEVRETLSNTLLPPLLGPLHDQKDVPKSELSCNVMLGRPG